MKRLFLPVLAGLAVLASAYIWPGNINLLYGSPTSTPFTPLHTYFMSPTGSDANNGLTTATAWASPNHAVVCGDVIIAQAGSYSQKASFGAVSNCPSTTGGIDGTGGIYFATMLCGGASVGDCKIDDSLNSGGGALSAIDIASSNWAVEGWEVSEGYTPSRAGFAYSVNTSNNAVGVRHHIAFINDIADFNAYGFADNSGGANGGSGWGVDYWAYVGDIGQDSAGRNDGFADSAFDVIGTKNFDTAAGTHIIVDGNFALNNQQTNAGYISDGEAIMLDTIDIQNYSQQILIKNNIMVLSERFNFLINSGTLTSNQIPIKVYNNTSYASNRRQYTNCDGGVCGASDNPGVGGYDLNTGSSAFSFAVTLQNNIGMEDRATGVQGAARNYALLVGGNYAHVTIGGTGNENVFKGQRVDCAGSSCDAGFNVVAFNSGSFGTNFYEDPAFNNLTDLMNNRMGTPNCSGFTNTTACMGWNFAGQTASNPSVIYDLTPTSVHSPGKGYQPPGACAADSDYPTWLKGIVYLQASGFTNGATLTENQGLVNRPCNL